MRDIQFDYPCIAILVRTTLQVFGNFHWIFSALLLGQVPTSTAIQAGQAFINPCISAAFGQHDNDCPGIAFTFLQNGAETSRCLDLADQTERFDMRGQTRVQLSPRRAERWRSRPAPTRRCAIS